MENVFEGMGDIFGGSEEPVEEEDYEYQGCGALHKKGVIKNGKCF